MPNPYREIFRAPGTKGFAAAGFVARLPIAMAPIGIVTMLSQTHGGYWLAGAVAAAFTLGNAVAAPQISRLVDRLGQRRLLAPTAAVSVLAFVLLMLATRLHWPVWTLFASALLAAAMPSMPAMVRARWTAVFRDRPELTTAFAFESAADELVYIAGASLSVGLSVAFFPEAGVLASTVFLAVGMAAFVLQRHSEPQVRPSEEAPHRPAITLRPVQLITAALIFVGAIFATAEVSIVAMTKALGQPGAATLVIALYALGSFAVGIILGALKPRLALNRQLLAALGVLLLTSLPLPFVGDVPGLAAAILFSGVAVSPTFITAFGLIERRVPPQVLTEGVTWVMTGIGIGMALGGRRLRRPQRLLGVCGRSEPGPGDRRPGPADPGRGRRAPGGLTRFRKQGEAAFMPSQADGICVHQGSFQLGRCLRNGERHEFRRIRGEGAPGDLVRGYPGQGHRPAHAGLRRRCGLLRRRSAASDRGRRRDPPQLPAMVRDLGKRDRRGDPRPASAAERRSGHGAYASPHEWDFEGRSRGRLLAARHARLPPIRSRLAARPRACVGPGRRRDGPCRHGPGAVSVTVNRPVVLPSHRPATFGM
jgi:MFS family permease